MNIVALLAVSLLPYISYLSSTTTNECPAYCRYKVATQAHKTTLRVRKDIKCMTDEEWATFRDTVIEAHKKGIIDRYTHIHLENFHVIHKSAQFFPWHRWFLFLFETELRKINANVTLPYWDGATDFVNPAASLVLSDTRGGGGGDPMKEKCVKNGMCNDWVRKSPTIGCIQRNTWETELPSWQSPEWVTHLLQANFDYNSFREGLEFSIHEWMHIVIGGDLKSSSSPNDIMFFLIHTNVDRIWAKWQLSDPKHYFGYVGPIRDIYNNKTTRAARIDDILDPWSITVKKAMVFAKEPLSYTYDEFLSDVPEKDETDAQKRLKELPDEVLQRFFPKIFDKTYNRYHFDTPPVCGEEVDGTIPRAVRPISINNSGPAAAADVELDSNLLIDTLNSVGYSTPYK